MTEFGKMIFTILKHPKALSVTVFALGFILFYLFGSVAPEDIGAFGFSASEAHLFESIISGTILVVLVLPTSLVVSANPKMFD